jgi:hypothetical protein
MDNIHTYVHKNNHTRMDELLYSYVLGRFFSFIYLLEDGWAKQEEGSK